VYSRLEEQESRGCALALLEGALLYRRAAQEWASWGVLLSRGGPAVKDGFTVWPPLKVFDSNMDVLEPVDLLGRSSRRPSRTGHPWGTQRKATDIA
jgi:hypothetical protein